jgi:hypothetical protein
MADTNLRARSTSEIIDAAFALYKQNGMQYTVVAAIAYAPVLIINLIMVGGTPPTAFADFGRLIPGMIASILALTLVSAMIARMGSDAYLGNRVDAGAALTAVMPQLPALLGAMVLFYLVMMLSFILAIFLLIPTLYVVARFFATSQVIVLEGRGAFESFGRSSALSKGRKIHILKTIALTWGLYVVISLGLSLLTRVVGIVVQQVVGSVFAVFAYPVVNLVTMVLYYDARIRLEGFDVEHMTHTLDASSAHAPMGTSAA